ncbi:MAG TPA: hypothetical protein VMG12_12285 [Polyangiaceae bacterium]|nr:hypothetical protein [Polyangiaceae bacterium]
MKPRSRAGSLIASACLAAASLGACAQILNVDGVEIVTDPAPAAGAGGGPSTTACEPGTFRCTGAALQLCEASDTAFRTVRVCSSPELCCDTPERCDGQPGCQPPACLEGEFRCSGAVLEVCNAGQTGFEEVDRCASALSCNASQGRCTELACDGAERLLQCSGSSLEECAPSRSEWTLVDSCASSALCDTEAEVGCQAEQCRIDSPSSPPSPYVCMSGNLMRCNDALTGWEFVETCLNPANCNALIEALVGDPFAPDIPTEQLQRLGCTPPGCAPGRYRCDGSELMLCGANRTGYIDKIDTCASSRHCDASRGRCATEPCSPGERQCNGDEYRQCTESGWQVLDTCASGAPCDPQTGCLATLCKPNEYRCDGAQLERCNVARDGWIPVRTCDTAGLCDVAAKRCDEPVCIAGATRCTRTGALEQCNTERNGWTVVADCAASANVAPGPAASALCDPSGTGRCLTAASCVEGGLRCNGAELERCVGNAWHPHRHCATAAQCDITSGTCLDAACDPGSFRCVNAADPNTPVADDAPRFGLVLQACNAFGTRFEPVAVCDGSELCDAAHGQCDICDPTLPAVCAGNDLLVCTADGQELTLYKVCAQGCIEAAPDGSSRTTCREDLTSASSN